MPHVCRARQRKACALDVTLWSEVLSGDDPWMRMLFPVNSLRSRCQSDGGLSRLFFRSLPPGWLRLHLPDGSA